MLQSEDLGVDWRIILKWILKDTECEGVDWIHVAQLMDQWRALVKTVRKL
jgi:hypothetical protein